MIANAVSLLRTAAFAAASCIILAGAAYAQSPSPAYTADDVIAHFAASANLGATRGLCIGTPSECGEVEVAKPKPFNLRVQFELGSATLTPAARAQLAEFATAASDPKLRRAYFNIDGHTDARGEDALNENLSQRRAAAVVDFLVANGVSRDKLVANGFGETRPLDDDPYADINRRVEASLAGLR